LLTDVSPAVRQQALCCSYPKRTAKAQRHEEKGMETFSFHLSGCLCDKKWIKDAARAHGISHMRAATQIN
jgi:hypothetical protein